MNLLTNKVLGRVLFSVPFIVFGINHVLNSASMGAMVLAGWPMAQVLVLISGLAMLAGAVGIISGKQGLYASLGTALLLVIYIATIHIPGLIAAGSDQGKQLFPMLGLMKDTGLLGGALALARQFHREG